MPLNCLFNNKVHPGLLQKYQLDFMLVTLPLHLDENFNAVHLSKFPQQDSEFSALIPLVFFSKPFCGVLRLFTAMPIFKELKGIREMYDSRREI